jgi:hypothetical protein
VERPEALDHINEVSPVPDEAWIESFNFSSFLLKNVEGHIIAYASGYTSLKQAKSSRQCRPTVKKGTTEPPPPFPRFPSMVQRNLMKFAGLEEGKGVQRQCAVSRRM